MTSTRTTANLSTPCPAVLDAEAIGLIVLGVVAMGVLMLVFFIALRVEGDEELRTRRRSGRTPEQP